jgi:hypothetical protein
LITEWGMWQQKVQEEIYRIGEENLKTRPDLFNWLFEGVKDNRNDGTESHYKHHYNQIKKALRKSKLKPSPTLLNNNREINKGKGLKKTK